MPCRSIKVFVGSVEFQRTTCLIRSDGGGRLKAVDRKGFALLEFFREKYHHSLEMTHIVSVDVSLLLLRLYH